MPKKVNQNEDEKTVKKTTTKTTTKKVSTSEPKKSKPTVKKATVKKETTEVENKNLESIATTKEEKIQKSISIKGDENKIQDTMGIFEILLAFIVVALIGGMIGYAAKGKVNPGIDGEYTVVNKELQKFIEQYNYILDNYYGEIDKEQLIADAISGMLSSLDPYSTFIDDESNRSMIMLEGSYEGMGVEIYTDKDGNIVILNVFDNSAASEAGLKPNDIITTLDGQSLEGKTNSDFVEMVKKIKSNKIKLGILRDKENIEVTLSKRTIILKSVNSQMLDNNIGYIAISIFAGNTDEQFKEALIDLESQGMKSLIIDVRNNSGGHLETVENMLHELLDSSHIIYQTESNTEKEVIYSKGKTTKNYPIAILINENSASASEILAATLQEELNAYLIGKTTYGKGTVQRLQNVSGVGQYKFTTKKWLTPSGKWIDGVGVTPDLKVELDQKYYTNPSQETDNQFQSAIKYLKNFKD